jgi:hypothetical protein
MSAPPDTGWTVGEVVGLKQEHAMLARVSSAGYQVTCQAPTHVGVLFVVFDHGSGHGIVRAQTGRASGRHRRQR